MSPVSYTHLDVYKRQEKNLVLEESIPAPVEPGQKAGVLEYTLGGKKLGEVNVLTNGSIRELSLIHISADAAAWTELSGPEGCLPITNR